MPPPLPLGREGAVPTEAEREFAVRSGLSGQTYPWGDELRPAGRTMCDI
jgi:formylglycine-generating enzyme required for sulfatase activity